MRQADDALSNPSSNPSFEAVLTARYSRRQVLAGGLVAAGAALLGTGGLRPGPARATNGLLGLPGVPVSTADAVVVPPGYSAEVLYAWGDPIGDGPAFRPDASNTIADQERQAGMHHDGIHYFPLPLGSDSSTRGLLAMNHEYTDDGLLHAGGMEPWTAEKVAKSQAAHGVSVIEVAVDRRPLASGAQLGASRGGSPRARRCGVSGPGRRPCPPPHCLRPRRPDRARHDQQLRLRGHALGDLPHLRGELQRLLRERLGRRPGVADPAERKAVLAAQKRYGINDKGLGYRWHEHDERFDAARHPNEPNRFGWVVEIDPFDPDSASRSSTRRSAASSTRAPSSRWPATAGSSSTSATTSGTSTSTSSSAPGATIPADRAANLRLLEQGTLYVARFDPDGSGEWLALVHGQSGLDAAAGFPSQAEVLVNARAAADVAARDEDGPARSGSRCTRGPARSTAR